MSRDMRCFIRRGDDAELHRLWQYGRFIEDFRSMKPAAVRVNEFDMAVYREVVNPIQSTISDARQRWFEEEGDD